MAALYWVSKCSPEGVLWQESTVLTPHEFSGVQCSSTAWRVLVLSLVVVSPVILPGSARLHRQCGT